MASNYSMKKFMRGALLLTIAAILAKVLSAIYRIPFQNMVGDQGFYVFQQVYPFASLFVVLASSGFAIAISKVLVDEQQMERRQQIKKVVFSYLLLLGLLFFIVLFFGAGYFAAWMGDEQLTSLIRIAAFVPLAMPLIAIFKGSFQAYNEMQRIAYAQLIEQSVRVVIILGGTMVVMATSQSIYTAGKVAIFGIVIGSFGSLLYLWLSDRQQSVQFFRVSGALWDMAILKKVTAYSISISMSSLVVILFQFVDSFTILNGLLRNGVSMLEAMTIKGIYDRGQSLVQFSMVLVSAMAMAIVPMIAYKAQRGKEIPYVQLTYRVSLLMSVAAAVGLVLVMPYANQMLFETDALSAMLSVYVLQIIPLCFVLTFTAVLQGYGKLLWPTVFIAIAILLKVLFNPLFIRHFDVYGAAIANNIALTVAAICFVVYIKCWQRVQLAKGDYYGKLVVATITMVVAVRAVEMLLPAMAGRGSAAITAAILIMVGVCMFLFVVAKLRLLAEREWFLLPFGRRMAALQLFLNRKK